MQDFYTYISVCPRFHEPEEKKNGIYRKREKYINEKEKRNGSEKTPGIIFLILLFSPRLCQGGFRRIPEEFL